MSEEGEKQVGGSDSAVTEEVPDPELDNLLNGEGVVLSRWCQNVSDK